MPFTEHTISGDTAAWNGGPLGNLTGRVEHNLGSQSLADEQGRLGSGVKLSFDQSGAFSVDLPASNDPAVLAEVDGQLQYQVHLSFVDPGAPEGGGKKAKAAWKSGWFPLNADVNAFTVVGSLTAEQAATGASLLAEMEALRDQTAAATGVPGAMAVTDADAGSTFRMQQDARLSETIGAEIGDPDSLASAALVAVLHTEGDGRWVVTDEAPWNPERDGAVGDGSTDDTAALQSSLNRGGPVRLIPGRTYRIGGATPLTPPAGSVLIGDRAVIEKVGAGRGIEVKASGAVLDGVTVDMRRDVNSDAGSEFDQQGVYVVSSLGAIEGVTLRNVTVRNTNRRGIDVQESAASGSMRPINNIRLDGCRVTNIGAPGSATIGARGIVVSQNTGKRVVIIDTHATNTVRAGISIPSASLLMMVGCTSTASEDHGIVLGQSDTYGVRGATILGSHATGAGKYGFAVSMNVQQWNILGGSANGVDGGITVDVESAADLGVIKDARGTVSGVAVKGNGTAAGRGILARYARGLVISGCTITSYQYGVQAATSLNTVVTGNAFDTLNSAINQQQATGVPSGRLAASGNTVRNVSTYVSGTVDYPQQQSFFAAAPASKQTGTLPPATDATSTQALVNDLRAKLVTLGLIS